MDHHNHFRGHVDVYDVCMSGLQLSDKMNDDKDVRSSQDWMGEASPK